MTRTGSTWVVMAILAVAPQASAQPTPAVTGSVLRDWPSSLTVESRPAYQPSSQSYVGMSLGITQLGSTTVSAAPFRLADTPPAWGFLVQLGFDGLNSAGVGGIAYRFDARWPFASRYRQLSSELDGDTSDGRRRLHLTWIGLVPAVTLGYAAGVAVEPHVVSDDGGPSVHLLRMNLSWRVGAFFETELTGTRTWRRAGPALPFSDTAAASVSALVVLPWVAGARPYDSTFLNTGLQQSIAVGPVLLVEKCAQRGDPRGLCGAVLEEELVGGAMELRLSPDIRPPSRLDDDMPIVWIPRVATSMHAVSNSAFSSRLGSNSEVDQ